MKSVLVCAILLSIGLASAGPETESARSEAWTEAPRDKVGARLEDWLGLFGSDYAIEEISSFRNLHTGDPMVSFQTTNGSTSVWFSVNLVTNDHYMTRVVSTSQEFMQLLGIREVLVDGTGDLELQHCWDAGCNNLRLQTDDSGGLSAVWDYYWD